MKVRGLVCSLLGGALLACGSTPTVIPARNLERPTDMGMVCLAFDPTSGQLSGQPMNACHPTGKKEDPIQESSSSPRVRGTFAFVSNTARGEMAVVDLDQGRLIDLDPVVFGFNMVQVGSLPESLSASPDGCWVASANRVSCDIGLVDPARLLSPLFAGSTPSTKAGNSAQRAQPKTASGRLLQLAPKEIVFLRPDLPLDQPPPLCSGQPSLALVSFPSCDLVALMELTPGDEKNPASAIIKDSVYISRKGTVPAGAEPICPVDYCVDAETVAANDDAGVSGEGDGGAGDAGEAGVFGNLGVGALVLRPDRPTVYVGASNGDDFLAVLDVVGGKLVDGGRIALEPGALGINHLRLSVDPWKTPTDKPSDMRGSFIRTRGEFLYAFAQDGSVRVVDVGTQPGRECDVNARPELAGPVTTPCFPVNRDTRQPLARGPGIRIPTLPVRTAAPPIPRDIAVVDLQVDAAQMTKNPQALAGQFGFLLASDSFVYVLNLSPHSTGDVEDQVMTHSFRETRASGQSAADMLLLVSSPPPRTTMSSDLLFTSTPLLSASAGPRLEKVTPSIPPAVPISSNFSSNDYFADFPNQSREVSRTISIAWEDLIPNTTRMSGRLSPPSPSAPAGTLTDPGADFCGKGVLPGDLLVLPGCTQDTDCSPQELYSCGQSVNGAVGLCLPVHASQGLLENCARFSGSRRRYEILDATPTSLSLGLHLDEVPKTVLNRAQGELVEVPDQAHPGQTLEDPNNPGQKLKVPSRPDSECQPVGSEAHKATGTRLGFSWQKVWPNEDFMRCVEPCGAPDAEGNPPSDLDRGCRPGFVCEALPGSLPAKRTGVGAVGYCVEAPPIRSECWPQPGNLYHVNVGTSFLVSGSMLPDLPTASAVSGHCQASNGDLLVNRIPLSAPACKTIDGTVPISTLNDPTKTPKPNQPPEKYPSSTQVALFGFLDQATGQPPTHKPPYSPVLPPGPNPCLYQDINRDEGATATAVVKAIFQNPEIRFVLTNLDQYAGDGLVTRLNLKGGFIPLTVSVPTFDVALTQPIRIFTGPTKTPDSPVVSDPNDPISYPYVYVLDQGRTALTPGSRGQIVRIDSRKGDSALATFDPATSGTQPFQIQ
jgi:hypothetical protein